MKKNLFAGLCAGIAFTLAPLAVQAQSTDIQRMNWRWAHFAPPAWGSAQADQLFAKEVETRTDGRVKTQFFWSGSLFGFGELFGAVSKNAIDVASFVPSYHPSEWPMMSLVNSLPMVWTDPKLAMRTQDYLIKNNKAIQAELRKHNLTPILLHGLPIYRLQCTMPIRKIEDLRGKRIRTFGDWPPYIMEKLGAVPVNIPLGQIYEGLQKGTLDCGYNPVENAGFLKLSEVAKFWSDIDFGAIAAYTTFMNTDRYQKLPDSLKKILTDSSNVAMQFEMNNFEPLEKKWLSEAQAAGVTLVKFEDQAKLRAMFPDMLGVWEETMCKRNMCPEAKSVVADIRKLLKETKR
jgi:TRAP-type transport system periplasmic protein